MTTHGLLAVHRCPHEQSPRSLPCHGQVTSKPTVALETDMVPLHGCRPPCRSRRRKALPPATSPAARRSHARFCSCPSPFEVIAQASAVSVAAS